MTPMRGSVVGIAVAASVAVVVTSCVREPPPPEPPVPTLPQVVGLAGYGDALSPAGVLVEERGCVFLETGVGRRWAIIWPPGSTAAWTNQELAILDAGGHVFAVVGERVVLGGQRLQARYAAEHSRPDATRLCGGASRYWLASPEKPAAQP
jgi:hypothetical protein